MTIKSNKTNVIKYLLLITILLIPAISAQDVEGKTKTENRAVNIKLFCIINITSESMECFLFPVGNTLFWRTEGNTSGYIRTFLRTYEIVSPSKGFLVGFGGSWSMIPPYTLYGDALVSVSLISRR